MDLALFEHCPGILVATSPEGVMCGFNPEAERVLGAEPVRGGSLFASVHPEDRDAFVSAWARMAEGEDYSASCHIRDAEGAYRSYTINARRSPGRSEVFVVLVPAPRAAAGRLAVPPAKDLLSLRPDEPERVLREILDHADMAVYVTDAKGVYTLIDGKACRSAGVEPGQLIGQNVLELYGSTPENLALLQRALGGELVHSTNEDRGVLWESWFIPERDERGEVVGMLGLTLAKNDMQKAMAELRLKMELIERQEEVIRNLETPVIQVWEKVITLPMVGIVDSRRAARVMDDLLTAVVQTSASFAILDLTGVDTVDTATAGHLFSLIRAIRLLGAEGIITGIKPTVAQTMVTLGLDLTSLTTCANLREGLRLCIRRMAKPVRED